MPSSPAVVACSTCGALYTPAPGDGRVCEACRVTVADDPAARPLPAPTPLFDDEPVRKPTGRIAPAPSRRGGRRRSLKGPALAVLAIALLGGAFLKRQSLERAWASIRHRSVSETWTTVQRRSGEAWLALRRLSPIESLRPAPVATAEASAAGISDDNSSHRRAHKRKRR